MIKIQIVDEAGRNAAWATQERLRVILLRLRNSGRLVQDGLLHTVRNHFRTIYPDSKHYDPDKVQPLEIHNGANPSASVEIDVPGITRAYHDMLIKPRFKRALTIPMHRAAYGKKAADFDNTFIVKKKNGNAFIAQKQGSQLVFLFRLARQVF